MTAVVKRIRPSSGKTAGFTLIEVLVALIVLAIGLLGVAGMQNTSLRSNHSALLRSQAVYLAQDIIDRMRVNRDQARNLPSAYNLALDAAVDAAVPDMAKTDLSDWLASVVNTLPGGRCSVAVSRPVVGSNKIHAGIEIRWTGKVDENGDGNLDEQIMSVGTLL